MGDNLQWAANRRFYLFLSHILAQQNGIVIPVNPAYDSPRFPMKTPSLAPCVQPLSRKHQRVGEKGTLKFLIAFTLIELLVVISIIAVLASLMFPVMKGVSTAAKRTSAKNDVVQLVNAMKSFYVEYGQYPNIAGISGAAKNATDNEKVMKVLLGADATINTRQIRYLEVSNTSSKSKSGLAGTTGTSGAWQDPWGNPYLIFWDYEYKGTVTIGGLAGTPVSPYDGKTLAMSVAAASKGEWVTGTVTGSNSVISW